MNVSNRKLIIVQSMLLIVLIASISVFSIVQFNSNSTAYASTSKFLTVYVSPSGPVTVQVNQTQLFTVSCSNTSFAPFSYIWTDENGSVLGTSQSFLFSSSQAFVSERLYVAVTGKNGERGYASVVLNDPYASSGIYLDSLLSGGASIEIQYDGVAWWQAINSNGQQVSSSATKNTVEQYAVTALTSSGGLIILRETTWDPSVSIPSNIAVLSYSQGTINYYGSNGIEYNGVQLATTSSFPTYPYGNLTGAPSTWAWGSITGVPILLYANGSQALTSNWNMGATGTYGISGLSWVNATNVYITGTGTFGNIQSTQPIGAYSYMIYQDPSFATNGLYDAKAANGTICWSSTNATTVIQNAFNNGNTTYIAQGTYILSSSAGTAILQAHPYLTVIGAGIDKTILYLQNSNPIPADLMNFSYSPYCYLNGFTLDGNYNNQAAWAHDGTHVGLDWTCSNYTIIDYVKFQNIGQWGLIDNGNANSPMWKSTLENCIFNYSRYETDNSQYCTIQNNYFYYGDSYGGMLEFCNSACGMIGNTVTDNIFMNNSYTNGAAAMWITTPTSAGVYRNTFSNNKFYFCYNSILIEPEYILGAGNSISCWAGGNLFEANNIYSDVGNQGIGVYNVTETNTFSLNTMNDTNIGIQIWNSTNQILIGNTVGNSYEAIELKASNNTQISGGSIYSNTYGLQILTGSYGTNAGSNINFYSNTNKYVDSGTNTVLNMPLILTLSNPSTGIWTTPPSSLGNAVDGSTSTATGVGNFTCTLAWNGANGYASAYLMIDLGNSYNGNFMYRLGAWCNQTNMWIHFYSSNDGNYVSDQTTANVQMLGWLQVTQSVENPIFSDGFPVMNSRYIYIQVQGDHDKQAMLLQIFELSFTSIS